MGTEMSGMSVPMMIAYRSKGQNCLREREREKKWVMRGRLTYNCLERQRRF